MISRSEATTVGARAVIISRYFTAVCLFEENEDGVLVCSDAPPICDYFIGLSKELVESFCARRDWSFDEDNT